MKKWLVRIALGLLALAGIAILAIIGFIAFDSLFPAQRVTDFTNVSYSGPNGVTLHAYLAKPQGAGPFPAILLVHEFFGLNADIIKKADLLAEQGYVTLAVDAYRGKTTPQIPRAIWLVVSTPLEQIQSDLQAGYQYLTELPEVNPQRIGSLGFCFGGTQVMHMATRNQNLAGTVIFYGSGPITDPAGLGVMDQGGPVLGIYGELDTSIPLEEVHGFELAMQARGVTNTVTVYPGVGHAFVHYDSLTVPGAAQEAWNQMLKFFEQNLKASS